MFKIKYLPFLLLLVVASFQSCVKTEFDEPPVAPLSDLVANITLADLKASIVDEYQTIEEDLIISGKIVSSDEAGNIYKSLFIEDETGGAVISIDVNNIFVGLPLGRTIFVKLNGLVVQDDDGALAIGSSVTQDGNFTQLNRIPELIAEDHIEKGPLGEAPTPRVISMSDINDNLVNTLVQFEAVQFTNAFAGGTYATPDQSVNTYVEDCNGSEIILRNSGFASFTNDATPTGKGTLTAILSKFNGDYQLFIRDTDDVAMNDPRCGETVSTLESNTTIAQLWDMHTTGGFESITEDLIIEGVVTSSDQTGNFFKVIYVEDNTAAVRLIVDAFDLHFDYPIGYKVFVKMNGLTLGDDNGALSIGSGVEDNNGTDRLARIGESQIGQFMEKGEAVGVNPTTIAIDAIDASSLNKLIRLEDVQFTDADAGETFADAANLFALNRTIEDCENTIVMRTSGYSDFADSNTPTGRGSAVAILSIFEGTYQLFISNTNDLNMTGERCDGTTGGGPTDPPPANAELAEGFDGTTQYEVIDLANWYNIAEVGSDAERWIGNEFDGNKYADASAYQSVDSENVNWLITPGIELDVTKTLTFVANQHHWASDDNGQLSVWISNDFDGSDTESANWMEVSCTLPTANNDWYEWVSSGNVVLNDYFASGEVFVGFKYEGEAADEVTGFQLDDVIVAE